MTRTMSNQLGAVILAVLFVPLCLFAEDKAQKTASPTVKTQTGVFSYSAQDRRDPFEVTYQARATKPTPLAQKRSGYELEELKVVGVVKTGAVKFVVMEDIQGRGLFFKKGDFINSSMWILEILDNQIILAHKLRGDIRKIPVDIPRKQEG
jgi:Tfp pilus assembly protein PilP